MINLIHFKNFLQSIFRGLFFVGVIVALAFYLASVEKIHDSTHLAATAFAIIIGAILSPWFFKYQHSLQAGVQFSAKKLLRLGIILYGFNITFNELYNIGFYGFLIAFIVISVVFLVGLLWGLEFLGLIEKPLCL